MASAELQLHALLESLGNVPGEPTPCDVAESILHDAQTDCPSAASWCDALRQHVSSRMRMGDYVAVLATGRICLAKFLQYNITGPILPPHKPLRQPQRERQETSRLGGDAADPDKRWVVNQLEVDGEDVVAKIQGLDLLLAALICLCEPLGYNTTTATQATASTSPPPAAGEGGPAGAAAGKRAAATAAAVVDTPGVQAGAAEPAGLQPGPGWLQQSGLGSWHWWCLRALLMHQHLLQGRSVTLRRALLQQLQATQAWLASSRTSLSREAPAGAGGAAGGLLECSSTWQLLQVALDLEAVGVHHAYGYGEEARRALTSACRAAGLEVTTTGALGVRTLHQVDAKAQLVVQVRPEGQQQAAAGSSTAAAAIAADPGSSSSSRTSPSCLLAFAAGLDVPKQGLGLEEVGLTEELKGLEDESEVYATPKLVDEGVGRGVLTGLEQALLLACATHVRKGTAKDELQQWQMAPYVEAVLHQDKSLYMLQAAARLLKARHERERPRTRERALMQLEQLCSALSAAAPAAGRRLPYGFTVNFPLWPLLRKEMAECYIAMGLVGAALAIYEEAEMWDQAITCYRLLDKKAMAQELVMRRLQSTPNDPKLWCALGDIRSDETHYHKAWEVSGHRNARAQRSLARSAVARKDYGAAAGHWELALGLSPMYVDAWFSLGYCYLKMSNHKKALHAFTQVTYLDPEQGEAWHNMSALWMQLGRWRQACHASVQATRLKRSSWQAWENYASAAIKSGQWAPAARALQQVFQLTNGERFQPDMAGALLEGLLVMKGQLEGTAAADGHASSSAVMGEGPAEGPEDDLEDLQLSTDLLQLVSLSTATATTGAGSSSRSSSGMLGPNGATEGEEPVGEAAGPAGEEEGHKAEGASGARREWQQLMEMLGGLLKGAVNSSAAGPAAWALLARWYELHGQTRSAQEAWLKQVRALQGGAYSTDAALFEEMAAASLSLGRSYLALVRSGEGGPRELSAARMHMRSVLKQCEECFGEGQLYGHMKELLQEILDYGAAAAAPAP